MFVLLAKWFLFYMHIIIIKQSNPVIFTVTSKHRKTDANWWARDIKDLFLTLYEKWKLIKTVSVTSLLSRRLRLDDTRKNIISTPVQDLKWTHFTMSINATQYTVLQIISGTERIICFM